MCKKSIYAITGVVVLVIVGLGLVSHFRLGVEDYLKVAEKFSQNGSVGEESYEVVIYNLEKALDISRKTYGDMSGETAEIYRKLGSAEKELSKASEYFDKARLIYETEGKMSEVADTQCDRGIMLRKAGEETEKQMEDAFQEAIDLYQKNGYANSDGLSMSYYYLADYYEDVSIKLEYLKKGEAQIDLLSPEKKKEICELLYNGIGMAYSGQNDYQSALAYFEKMTTILEDPIDEKGKAALAHACQLSGASMVYLEDTEPAKEQLERSISIYEELGSEYYPNQIAEAYTYLAAAYAFQKEPDEKKMLVYGETAFSYYKNRNNITSGDLEDIAYMQTVLLKAFEKVYPEDAMQKFENWSREVMRLYASTYYFSY